MPTKTRQPNDNVTITRSPVKLSRRLNMVMAVMCGTVVSNLYYAQPLLPMIAEDLRVSAETAASVVTLTQAGYACGLVLIVPLGDIRERRHLIQTVLSINGLALCATGLAPSILFLQIAAFAVGLTTVAVQVIVPFAADLADDAKRGRAVGIVMGGLFTGILASRIVSGFVADIAGWRAIYGVAAVAIVLVIIVAQFELPLQRRMRSVTYRGALGLLPRLVLSEPHLRRRSLMGGLAMATLMAVWSTIAFPLSEAPFKLDEAAIGLLGLAGLVGVTGANLAGRSADKGHQLRTAIFGIVAMLGGLGLLSTGDRSLALIIAGILVLDYGPAALSITNQSLIYRLRPESRGAITTVYVSSVFIGASTGSLLGAISYVRWGLDGVCGVGAIATAGVAITLVVDELALRTRARRHATAVSISARPNALSTVRAGAATSEHKPVATQTEKPVAIPTATPRSVTPARSSASPSHSTSSNSALDGAHYRATSRPDVLSIVERLRIAEIVDAAAGNGSRKPNRPGFSIGASVATAISEKVTKSVSKPLSPASGKALYSAMGAHFRDTLHDADAIHETIDVIEGMAALGADRLDEIESQTAASISREYDVGTSVIVVEVPWPRSSHPTRSSERASADESTPPIHVSVALSKVGHVPICSIVRRDAERPSTVINELASRSRDIFRATDITAICSGAPHLELIDRDPSGSYFGFVADVPISRHRELSAVPLRRYRPLDHALFSGVRVFETEALAFGRVRRVVLAHSDQLHKNQQLHYDGLLRAACNALGNLAAHHGLTIDCDRRSLETEISEILSRYHARKVIHVDILGDDPRDLRIAFKLDQHAKAALEAEVFGKKLIFTDQTSWTAEEIVDAYGARSTTRTALQELEPLTDQDVPQIKLRAQTVLTTLALSVARLAHLAPTRVGE